MKKPGSGRAFSCSGSLAHHFRVRVPFISAEWPGKVQKNMYYSPSFSLETSKVTESFSPEPISLVWAMTRLSSGFR